MESKIIKQFMHTQRFLWFRNLNQVFLVAVVSSTFLNFHFPEKVVPMRAREKFQR